MKTYAAVDLSPAQGRVIAARINDDQLDLTEVKRFRNRPIRVMGTLHWDVLGLFGEVLDGLRALSPGVASVGVSGWAADYGLLDAAGALLGNPVHRDDARTEGVMRRVHAEVTAERLFTTTGTALEPTATVYQLVAATRELHRAGSLLLLPDLIGYWLTGSAGSEITNASSTGLLDMGTRNWSAPLMDLLGLPERLFRPLREPGDTIGVLLPDVAAETGLTEEVSVTAVASLDSACAVTAVPAADEHFAYIVCGATSHVGLEVSDPVPTTEARAAGFAHRLGTDGTIRFERETAGLLPLRAALAAWDGAGRSDLLADAVDVPPLRAVVDLDAPELRVRRSHDASDLSTRIAAYCRRTGQRPPAGRPETVRCIIDSLALAHRSAVLRAAALSGHDVRAVHVVGPGADVGPLCQAIADACGRPVIAGPAEARPIGNALAQALSFGTVKDLGEIRALVARTRPVRRFEPRSGRPGDERAWARAAARLSG